MNTFPQEKEIALLDLKHEIRVRGDFPEAMKDVYCKALNERIAKARLLQETQKIQKAYKNGDSESLEKHSRRFNRYSEFIYGAPDQEIFSGVQRRLQELINVTPDTNSEIVEAKKRLQQYCKPIKKDYAFSSMEIEQEREVVVDAEQLRDIFADALHEYGLTDWRVVISSGGKTNISVFPGQQKISLPNSTQLQSRPLNNQLTPQKIAGLIAHEIGTHAVRSENGKKSQLKLLSIGLDRYESGEEGVALWREHQHTGADDYSKIHAYLAEGLAKGLDGGEKRTMGEVFKILRDVFLLTEFDTKKAGEAALRRCVRTFRGTSGTVPGCTLSKDLIYRKGAMAIYEFMNTNFGQKINLDIGKFDPSNQRHVSALIDLGILDSDLNELQENA